VSEAGGGAGPGPDGDREAFVELVLRTFRLNGMFLQTAERLAKPAGLTAAWWQVLGAVLRQPLTVSDIAREMGLTRQSVQRVADLLVERRLAEYRTNPAHARAKLLAPTDAGWEAIGRLRAGTLAWARAVTDEIGEADIRHAVQVMDRIVAALPGLDVPAGEAGAVSPPGRRS
jgi:DNA-binding MarR family transcriptional regulator